MATCPMCGKDAADNAKFCSRCGTVLGAGTSRAPLDAAKTLFDPPPSAASQEPAEPELSAQTRRVAVSAMLQNAQEEDARVRAQLAPDAAPPVSVAPVVNVGAAAPNPLEGRPAPQTVLGIPGVAAPAPGAGASTDPRGNRPTVRTALEVPDVAGSAWGAPPAVEPAPVPTARDDRPALRTALGIPGVALPPNAAVAPTAPIPAAAPAPAPIAAEERPALRTVLGIPGVALPPNGPSAPAPAPVAAEERPALRTVLGIPGVALPPNGPSAPAPAPVVAEERPALRTVLGIPGVALPDAAGAPSAAVERPAAHTVLGIPGAQPPAGAPLASDHRTMLGVALPGIAPTQPGPNAPTGEATGGPRPVPNAMATMLGMSAPAALAGAAAAAAAAPPHAQPEAPGPRGQTAMFLVPEPKPFVEEPMPSRPVVVEKKKGGVSLALGVGIAAVVVVLLGVGIFFVARGSAPIKASAAVDDTGHDVLVLRCEGCPDGTIIKDGPSAATLSKGAGRLALATPLRVGNNDLTLHVDRPGVGRDEEVKLVVPVSYRLRADAATVEQWPPKFVFRAEAAKGVRIEVDGAPLAVDANGVATSELPLGPVAEGSSDAVAVFEKIVPYKVVLVGGAEEKGTLTLRTRVLPLKLDTPRPDAWTFGSTVSIAGQAAPTAKVFINGAAAPVDDRGVFDVQMPVGDGHFEVHTERKDAAARGTKVAIRKMTTAERAAAQKDFESKATLKYADYAKDVTPHIGKKVVVDGEVVEARASGKQTVVLVDQRAGCSGACLTRVVVGGLVTVPRGAKVRVYGHISRKFEGEGGTKVPEVDAELLAKPPRFEPWP